MRTFPPLRVDPEDAATLRGWTRCASVGPNAARRARIVLRSAEGVGPTALAAELGCSPQTVLTWRERYRTDGISGLADAPRPGRPVTVDQVAVVERTLYAPPPRLRVRRWSSRLLAAEMGVSNVAVAKVWRSWGISPLDDGHVRLGADPPLDHPPAAFAGVHLDAAGGVLAVVAATGRPDARMPVRARPRLGSRFGSLDLGGTVDGAGLVGFLDRFDDTPGERLRLLVDRTPAQVRHWARRRGAQVHTVPSGLDWTRMVRVAAVLAGATPAGAASVAGLRGAVIEHRPGRPLHWHHPDAAAC
jgi:transposase